MKASAASGSNWVPALRAISRRASAIERRGAVGAVGRDRVEARRPPRRSRAASGMSRPPAGPGSPARPSARGGGARRQRCRRRGSRRRAGSPSRSRDGGASARTPRAVSALGLYRIASGTATLPTSCSRKPNSSAASSATSSAGRRAELQAVGGHALGVLAGVGVARLDGVGERPHGRHVGAADLRGMGALAPDALAELRDVARRPPPRARGSSVPARRARRAGARPLPPAPRSACPRSLPRLAVTTHQPRRSLDRRGRRAANFPANQRFSRETSTETSSTGSGIGGSGLVACTVTAVGVVALDHAGRRSRRRAARASCRSAPGRRARPAGRPRA